MADRLEDLLRACTVRVVGGPMTGAGFFVAPGTVITCAHVAGNGAGLTVRWDRDSQPPMESAVSGPPVVLADRGRPIPALDADYPDLAVLPVASFDGHPCVSIDLEWPDPQDQFQVFGYPREGGAEQLTPARLTYRGTHGTAPTAYLDLASDTIKPGMSGAAVLNLRSGGVCGVVVASKHPDRPDGALVIPWAAVEKPLAQVLAANQAHQLRNLRWATAAGQQNTQTTQSVPGHATSGPSPGRPVRVFISYAHEDKAHEDRVRQLWMFLRAQGVDARLDLPAGEQRQDWAQWMMQEVRDADYVLVITSPAYKRRAEGDAAPDEGRGVQWEARLIRDVFYADQDAGLRRFLPVVLPGCSPGDIPLWLAPASASYYVVSDFSVPGMEKLYRLLTGQPWETAPELGTVIRLLPRESGQPAAASAGSETAPATSQTAEPSASPQSALHTEGVIEVAVSGNGILESVVWLAGTQLCRQQAPLPFEVTHVWQALRLPALTAGERLAEAGRRLATALLDDQGQALLAGLVNRLPPDGTVEVVLSAKGPALSLPIELLRLNSGNGETAPLGLIPAVSIARRPATQSFGDGPGTAPPAVSTAGPLKVLAAVAAPDETKTGNTPLDTEAEMAAVLEAVSDVAAGPHAQVRILEVASLQAIRDALTQDAYHVLHLSAHGFPEAIELEDEDGNSQQVTAESLMRVLQHAGRPVPLIMLSSCSGGAASTQAMAAGLIARGADRVIAMLAPVTDDYATTLARYFYGELAARPVLSVGQALAKARYLAEEQRSQLGRDPMPVPEYGVVTLLAAGSDGPLTDPAVPETPLRLATARADGNLVRDLPVGELIGRRAQLRDVMGVLRRTQWATDRFGAANGVVLTGVGGIGKTALAGRAMSRLRDEGWLIAVHEGRWNPDALINATVQAITDGLPKAGDPPQADALRAVAGLLADPGTDDGPKLHVIRQLLGSIRLLVVLDDFEQNLATGGDAFLDPAVDEAISGLADAAGAGAVLVTCRYPLPGPDRFLVPVPIPPLSSAELRRLFLRLPSLRELSAEDRRLLMRTIGGHPRLIQFTDALLRGGRSNLMPVQVKLRDLAQRQGLSLRGHQPLDRVLDQAMLLGSADILLVQLVELLTPAQQEVLRQVAVCRAPMTLDDLMFTLTPRPEDKGGAGAEASPDLTALPTDLDRLTDLTLLTAGADIVMHPWTAALVTRNTHDDLSPLHERALAMRWRRFNQRRGTYEDLIDICRHLAALRRYDDIADIAQQAPQIVPGTLSLVACLAELRPLIPANEQAWIIVAGNEADALLQAGNMPLATLQLQTICQQLKTQAAAEPSDTAWQRLLSVSHNRLGDVAVAAGDLAGARTAYQASLDIRTRLAAADPANTQWQRDLSVSHDRLGDVARAAGDLAGARTAHQASLGIAEQLAAADPANTTWQRDLSVSYNKLGDVAVAAGDLAGARTAHQASLDIRTRLAAADPANTTWQRDLSVSYNKLGDVAVAAGDLAGARTAYQAGLGIAEQLAAADPANTEWQRDLSVSYNKLGDVAVAAGDLAGARTAHQASLDIRTRLAAADPANTTWQRDLSVSYNKLGDVAVAAGDLAGARTAHQASLGIAEQLAAADPANTTWQRDLSVSYNKLGDVAVAAGDLAGARTAYQAGLGIAEQLAAADPTNTEWQRDLSVSHDRLGDVAVAAGDLAGARTAYQAGLGIAEQLAAADPANTTWQRDLSVSHSKLGDVAVAAGDLAGARTAYQAGLGIAEQLAAADPANTQWQRDLELAHQRIGDLLDTTD